MAHPNLKDRKCDCGSNGEPSPSCECQICHVLWSSVMSAVVRDWVNCDFQGEILMVNSPIGGIKTVCSDPAVYVGTDEELTEGEDACDFQ